MLTKKRKQNLIKKHQAHEKDTGSSHVQVGLLVERIGQLSKHLKKNPKDNHSRRGLLGLVQNRRKHEKYSQKKSKK